MSLDGVTGSGYQQRGEGPGALQHKELRKKRRDQNETEGATNE